MNEKKRYVLTSPRKNWWSRSGAIWA